MQGSLFAAAEVPLQVPDASSDDWFTPSWLLAWLPSIALDPCWSARSNVRASAVVDASTGDDGLWGEVGGWAKRAGAGQIVYVNPPYSDCARWVERCEVESRSLSVPVVALVPAYSGDAYWHRAVWRRAQFVGFLAKRLRFDIAPGVPAPSCASFTSAFVVWGDAVKARAVVAGIAALAGERVFWVDALTPAIEPRAPAKPVQHGPAWACVSSGAHPGSGRVDCVRCGKRIEWASWFARRCSDAA